MVRRYASCSFFVFCTYYKEKYRRNKIGFYRKDILASFGKIGRPKAEHISHNVIDILKIEIKLNISSETNVKVANFCNVTFNLITGKYQPKKKPDNDFFYIDVSSNDPPNNTRNLSYSIFHTDLFYHTALSKRGFKDKIYF